VCTHQLQSAHVCIFMCVHTWICIHVQIAVGVYTHTFSLISAICMSLWLHMNMFTHLCSHSHMQMAKEPYKRDLYSPKSSIILRSLLIVATPYTYEYVYMCRLQLVCTHTLFLWFRPSACRCGCICAVRNQRESVCVHTNCNLHMYTYSYVYEMAMISRLLKIIPLFGEYRSLL